MANHCGIILLAAGSSSRLGRPKQALVYKEVTLLQHSIDVALAADVSQVIVVLGEHAPAIASASQEQILSIVVNEHWQEGMASSIRCGLESLLAINPAANCALFMVCDQPFINTALLNNLVTLQKQTGQNMVASEYAGTVGIPAIFGRELFPALLALKEDAGAKKIMQAQQNMTTVAFPLGDIDIDTAADYQRLQKM